MVSGVLGSNLDSATKNTWEGPPGSSKAERGFEPRSWSSSPFLYAIHSYVLKRLGINNSYYNNKNEMHTTKQEPVETQLISNKANSNYYIQIKIMKVM